MERIAIIGCGIIGATIAYELSLLDRFTIDVFDASQPAQASTGAALGVLMGIISQKVKGRAWQLRERSIRRYQTLIPELERSTRLQIPHNHLGILKLLPADSDRQKWQQLADTRAIQGWQLELWERSKILELVPQINPDIAHLGVYSPQDLQIEPISLVNALVAAAKLRGVTFHFDRIVTNIDPELKDYDRAIVTAGLGANSLTQPYDPTIDIRPVWGQAIDYQLPENITLPKFQPVISYNDVHLVPCEHRQYWVGATVEFASTIKPPDPSALTQLQQQALDWFPILDRANILRTWQGQRPRPENRPAPIIDRLTPDGKAIVATGHYRNGILLAPVTAQLVIDLLGSR
jgi:glycine oxidase